MDRARDLQALWDDLWRHAYWLADSGLDTGRPSAVAVKAVIDQVIRMLDAGVPAPDAYSSTLPPFTPRNVAPIGGDEIDR